LNTQLLGASEAELTSTRKNYVKYIFQDAANCFDPLKKLEYYFKEVSQKDELESYLNYFLLPTSDDILKKFPSQLSIGSVQRVAIIWGLLAKTPLLLLDEPTSALDTPLINLLSHKLKTWCQDNNSAIIIVTQNTEFAVHTASSVAILIHGGLNFDLIKQVLPIEQELKHSSQKNI